MNQEEIAIEHMNKDHKDVTKMLCKHYGAIENPTEPVISGIDADGMTITCKEKIVRVPFLSKANKNGEGYQKAMIELISSLNMKDDTSTIEKDALEFIDSFKSVLISSFNEDHCVCSYSPFIRQNNEFFILISEVSEHYNSIFRAPEKISIMFLEDESKAKTVFARKRVSFRARAVFIDDIKEELFPKFEEKFANEAGIKHIKNMSDFHIVKIMISKGRFVKGFGAAYDLEGFKILNRVHEANPHQIKK